MCRDRGRRVTPARLRRAGPRERHLLGQTVSSVGVRYRNMLFVREGFKLSRVRYRNILSVGKGFLVVVDGAERASHPHPGAVDSCEYDTLYGVTVTV